MTPDETFDPELVAAAAVDPHLAAATTAIVLALIAAIFLLALLNEDEFRR